MLGNNSRGFALCFAAIISAGCFVYVLIVIFAALHQNIVLPFKPEPVATLLIFLGGVIGFLTACLLDDLDEMHRKESKHVSLRDEDETSDEDETLEKTKMPRDVERPWQHLSRRCRELGFNDSADIAQQMDQVIVDAWKEEQEKSSQGNAYYATDDWLRNYRDTKNHWNKMERDDKLTLLKLKRTALCASSDGGQYACYHEPCLTYFNEDSECDVDCPIFTVMEIDCKDEDSLPAKFLQALRKEFNDPKEQHSCTPSITEEYSEELSQPRNNRTVNARTMRKFCRYCGAEFPADFDGGKFCENCGASVQREVA